jgi:transmembrane sensor
MTNSPRPDERASREAHAWTARLRGEPSARDRADFELWYSSDPARREAYDRIASDWANHYGFIAQTSLGRNRTGLPQKRVATRPASYALAAASLAVLLIAGLLLLRPGTEAAAQAAIFATAVGEIRTVTLPDESRLTLDTATRVAVRYQQQERLVELQEGRIRVTVRRTPDYPFVVVANGSEVVARGTTFDVSLAPGGATVALLEGEIEVRVNGAVGSAQASRKLRAGERILLRPQGRLRKAVPASSGELRWPSGMLEFRNQPLGQAIAEANRYSTRQIRIGDPAVAQLRLTGTFRAGETLSLARSLAEAFRLRVEESPGGDLVLLSTG